MRTARRSGRRSHELAPPPPDLAPLAGVRVIASVRGEVIQRLPGEVVIEAAGVGYRLAVSSETFAAVANPGQEAKLHTHLVLRDDGMHLFGFSSEAERELFLMLIGVQGVGPKMALAVLSGGAPRELLNAIASGDTARFQAVPGIGKRTAERIIVELREKVAGKATDDIVVRRIASDDPRTLAREGLLGLGFTPLEADKLLDHAAGETPEDLIAGALRAAR
jgi:holliday junction DNA helicase RuvA